MSRGDRVEVVVDTGGDSRSFTFEADANGRRLEVRTERSILLVELVARTGKVIATNRFMPGRVIALIETKVEEPEAPAKPPSQQESLSLE